MPLQRESLAISTTELTLERSQLIKNGYSSLQLLGRRVKAMKRQTERFYFFNLSSYLKEQDKKENTN